MITSIIDNDLYKFTTSYAYMKLFPHALGAFEFTDRNNTVYTQEQLELIKSRIYHLTSLKLTKQEKEFMSDKCYYIPPCYFEWLEGYRYDSSEIKELCLDSEGHLKISVSGLLYRITLWEVPILAIVSEVLATSQGVVSDVLAASRTIQKASIAENE